MKSTALASAIALTLVLAMQPASASDYSALKKARKYPEAERLASAKLAQDPANVEAMAARTDAILAAGDETRIGEAVKQAEQCVATQANNAGCHLVLGKALGSKAMNGGMMSAMGYVGTIRDSFKKAVELDPRNLDARFSLLQFYMMAPGIMGGGSSKAEALATQTAAVNADAGKLMQSMLALSDGKLAKAEADAVAAHPGADDDLQEQQEAQLVNVAFKFMQEKKFADADRVFRDTLKRYPDSDNSHYGIARVQQEQGKHREALAVYEQVLVKMPKPHVYYRIAQSQQALGEKAKATASYEKTLSFKNGLPKKLRSDAEDQLKALKG